MEIKVLVADGGAAWCLLQAPTGELQCRPLGYHLKITTFFWQRALGLLLSLYRDWRLDHELPSTLSFPSWTEFFLNHETIKLGMHGNTPSSNGSGVYVIGLSSEGTSYLKEWSKFPWSPLPPHYLLSPSLYLPSWGIPCDQLTEDEKTQGWFTIEQWFHWTGHSTDYAGTTQKWAAAYLWSLTGISL